MSRSDLPSVAQRVLLIVIAVGSMGGMLYAIQQAAVGRGTEPTVATSEVVPAVPGDPIAAEADVFRTRPGMEAVEPDAQRRPNAHPRTLATYRLLRSYPGAPPRVPHGLTSTEFRSNRCNTCHERGGYSPRFNAYVPVNPHPQWEECLQCHATNSQLVGVPFPAASPDEACRQCHSGIPTKFAETGLDWPRVEFPSVLRGDPAPVIPHDLATRGNCLACHMGPSAVAEIRTTHPERSNCRQCHVTAVPGAGEFVRPRATAGAGAGGMP